MMKKLALVLVLVLGLTACGSSLPPQTPDARAQAVNVLHTLEQAQSIEIKKSVMAIGDHWSLRVNGREVATIEGLNLKVAGDVYSILSPNGGLLGGEDEDIFHAAKTAHFYDRDQRVTATLTKKIFSFNARYTLANDEGVQATLDQKFALTFKGNIENADGDVIYSMSSKALSMASDLTLTRESDSTSVSALDALRMAVVAKEIYDGENDN